MTWVGKRISKRR